MKIKNLFKKTIKLEPQEEKELEAVKLWEVSMMNKLILN